MHPPASDLVDGADAPFLVACFREFYGEVIRERQAVLQAPRGAAPAARELCMRLEALLERQAREARRRGEGSGRGTFQEAQYVMAAVADEVFVSLEWEGSGDWCADLLEARLFRSHLAGETFFRRLDHLLQLREEVDREVAAVYLLALAVGFQGKYRETEALGELEEYRRKLFSFVFGRQPSLLLRERRLFPQAHAHTRGDPAGLRLPRLGPWIVAVAAVLLLYLGISHGLWRDVTLAVADANRDVAESISSLPGR